MIDEKLLIEEFKKLQGVDTLANMFISDVIKVIKKQPVLNTEAIDETYLQLVKENTELKKRLAADDWIPVEERLPEQIENVLSDFDSFMQSRYLVSDEEEVGTAVFDEGIFKSIDGYTLFNGIVAWKPFPEPYRPKDTGITCTETTAAEKAINAGIKQGIKEASDPCHGCFGASNNDCQGCWKKSMMNTFLGSREGR